MGIACTALFLMVMAAPCSRKSAGTTREPAARKIATVAAAAAMSLVRNWATASSKMPM